MIKELRKLKETLNETPMKLISIIKIINHLYLNIKETNLIQISMNKLNINS